MFAPWRSDHAAVGAVACGWAEKQGEARSGACSRDFSSEPSHLIDCVTVWCGSLTGASKRGWNLGLRSDRSPPSCAFFDDSELQRAMQGAQEAKAVRTARWCRVNQRGARVEALARASTRSVARTHASEHQYVAVVARERDRSRERRYELALEGVRRFRIAAVDETLAGARSKQQDSDLSDRLKVVPEFESSSPLGSLDNHHLCEDPSQRVLHGAALVS